MKKFLKTALVYTLYATFLVPMVVIPSSYIFPFIVPKIVLFRTLVAAMIALFALLYIQDRQTYALKPTVLTLAIAAFVGSFALSTFFGTDAYHSFWDNHERMLGLFTILHYFAYYLIATTILTTWTEWKWALRLFLLAGTIVTSVGVLEIISPDIVTAFLPTNVGNILSGEFGGRVSSLLGNAIYLGGYGLFLLAVSVVLFRKEQLVLWRIISAVCAVTALGAMYVSGTRGSFLGLGAGLVFALGLSTWVVRSNVKMRNILGASLAACFLLLGVLYIYRQTDAVKAIPMVGRILNSSLSSGTGSTRLIAWKIAVESWKERPILGWGPNNFFYAFNAYYNPMSLRFGFGETWFDNAHNILLNTLAVQGVVGLVTYLGMFGAAVWVLFKNKVWREKHPDLFVIFAAFLAAHFTQNLTVFENPTSYLFFMFWLALINSLTGASAGEEQKTAALTAGTSKAKNNTVIDKPKQLNPFIIGGVAVVFVFWVYVFNYEPASANKQTLTALQSLGSTSPAASMTLVKEVLNTSSPHIDDIRSDVARSVVSVVNTQNQKMTQNEVKDLIDLVYPSMKENLALHPRDIRNHLTEAQLGQLAFMATKNPQYVYEAEKILTDALVFSPRRQQLIYSLSGIKAQLGKKEEAVSLLAGTIVDDPTIGENYWRLAFLYQYLGETTKAKQVLDDAHAANVPFNDQGKDLEANINALLAASSTKKK